MFAFTHQHDCYRCCCCCCCCVCLVVCRDRSNVIDRITVLIISSADTGRSPCSDTTVRRSGSISQRPSVIVILMLVSVELLSITPCLCRPLSAPAPAVSPAVSLRLLTTMVRGYAYTKIEYVSVRTYLSKNRIRVWYVSYTKLGSPRPAGNVTSAWKQRKHVKM